MNTSPIRNPYRNHTFDPVKTVDTRDENYARNKVAAVQNRLADMEVRIGAFDNREQDRDPREGYVSITNYSRANQGGAFNAVMTPDYMTAHIKTETSDPLSGTSSKEVVVHREKVDGKITREYERSFDPQVQYVPTEANVAYNSDGTITLLEGHASHI